MKITIESYDFKFSCELPDNCSYDDFFENLDILLRTTWADEQVNEYLK